MKGISLELYRVFLEIARTRNLTRAAENLYVTQPNVSVALKTLEEGLGAALCIRTKKGVILTKEGEALYTELEKAFEHIGVAERNIEKLAHMDSGTISISASDTVCNYFLLPYITAFASRYPGIRLGITNRTSLETIELLKSGKIDFGFINLPFSESGIVAKKCGDMHDILVGGRDYSNLTEKSLPLASIPDYPLIMLERKSNSRLCLDKFFGEKGIILSPILELGSLDLLISFVKSNMGIAFIPEELCGRFVDSETVFHIRLEEEPPVRGLALAELEGAVLSRAAAAFREMVLAGEIGKE